MGTNDFKCDFEFNKFNKSLTSVESLSYPQTTAQLPGGVLTGASALNPIPIVHHHYQCQERESEKTINANVFSTLKIGYLAIKNIGEGFLPPPPLNPKP